MSETTESIETGTATEEATNPLGLHHTLLEMWASVLNNVDTEREVPLSPQMALSVVAKWPQMKVQEVNTYRAYYYDNISELRDVVSAVILAHPEALKNVETDAVDNRVLYLDIVAQWQYIIQLWEKAWSAENEDSHISLAAMADSVNFVLSSQGLVAHVDQIGIQATPEELDKISATVAALAAEDSL